MLQNRNIGTGNRVGKIQYINFFQIFKSFYKCVQNMPFL